jgi:hypothetical protein
MDVRSRVTAFATGAIASLWLASAAAAQCTTGGGGGTSPGAGAVNGTWPTTAPTMNPLISPMTVTIPSGSVVCTSVTLRGYTHTWMGDAQIVLQDPAGGMHNLYQNQNGVFAGGCSTQTNGDYTIVDPVTGTPAVGCPGGVLTPGTYAQDVGSWPTGSSGIDNMGLESIPVTPGSTGTWTLYIYDWYVAFDNANLSSWEICFGPATPPPPPNGVPTLGLPSNGVCITTPGPVSLDWSSVQFATNYDLELDSVVTALGNTLTTSVAVGAGQHSWRVRGTNAAGIGGWSSMNTFGIASTNPGNCVTGGASGAFPFAGTDGTWPLTLPTGELIAPLAVTIPAGSSKITGVRINGLNHTWSGDCQFVLQSPAGVKYNLFQQVDGNFGGGCSDDFAGDYTFVDVNNGLSPCGGPATVFACGSPTFVVQDTTLAQYFGAWVDGDAGIFNTPLESIPIANGTWNLIAYDWYVNADSGSITSWDLCFDTVSGPTTYCTPNNPGTSHSCIPTIGATANPNVAHGNTCIVTVANVEGTQSGIIFYGVNGTVSVPWCQSGGNSFLCVKAPLWRTNVQNSGGTFGLCNGALTLDWNAYQLANPGAFGNPWSAGDQAHVQGWFRDPPSCKTTFLSQGLELTYVP